MRYFVNLKSFIWPSSRSFHGRVGELERHLAEQLKQIEQNQEVSLQILQQIQEVKNEMLEKQNVMFHEILQFQARSRQELQDVILNKIDQFQTQAQHELTEIVELQKQMPQELQNQMQFQMHWLNEQNEYKLRQLLREVRRGFFNLDFELQRVFSIEQNNYGSIYNDNFYSDNRYGSVISGYHVLRKILDIVNANSIVDFGCGTGTWLYAAKNLGVTEIYGIDGNYVNRSLLMISNEEFAPYNLEEPIFLLKRYDMAISLEVAEHLHESAAEQFVEGITKASDVILFSAAHPGQGGDGHINEQPFEYWQERFKAHGYEHLEIRTLFKDDWEIEEWYRENIALYVQGPKYNQIKSSLLMQMSGELNE